MYQSSTTQASSPWLDLQAAALSLEESLLYDLQPEHASESATINAESALHILRSLYALKAKERALLFSRISLPLQQLSGADTRSAALRAIHTEQAVAMQTAQIVSNVLRLAQQTMAEFRYIDKAQANIVPALEVNDPWALGM